MVCHQRVEDIHRDLIIADQWTEPHSPWQNPAELNGVTYLKSHSQVFLNSTGAPDNLCFQAQDFKIVNSTGKYQNRYQGGMYTDISHILMFYWFEGVLYFNPVSTFQ
jgi:hypothetical protein